ncbi:MAG: molybdenum cofactor guanylyltransferase [Desulfobacterales bacterium]|nr:molybdenum cofactor guanylyltransferase [Desulfobacterales bacterium]
MDFPCSGIILAGGRNARFNGKNKAFLQVGGEKIIDRIGQLFKEFFDEIILVTNHPVAYLDRDFQIVTDLFPIQSPLTGIHAGLFYATHPYSFFIACDTPFLKPEMIELVLTQIEPGYDVIIPDTALGFQPLCAAYSKGCLKPIGQHLLKQNPLPEKGRILIQELKVRKFFENVRLKKIPEKLLRARDPELLSFFNINTPEDLAIAQGMSG